MKSFKIGIVGFGTVGRGTARVLVERKKEIAARVGREIQIAQICDRQIPAEIPFGLPREIFTENANEIIENPEIDAIVELVGGVDFAKNLISKSLRAGKNVVTANKHLLARAGGELFNLARENGKSLLCEAAVAGAIPCLQFLRKSFAAGKIQKVEGILNGTANFILSKLQNSGGEFSEILKIAQDRGFAEADPTFDIDGIDTADKIAILASFCFGGEINFSAVQIRGISNLIPDDFEFARQNNRKIKLVASAEKIDGQIFARVRPVLVKKYSAIGQTDGVLNCVQFSDSLAGKIFFSGAGAGGDATGTALVSDLAEIARGADLNSTPFLENENCPAGNASQLEQKSVFRIVVRDEPGILAKVAQSLADEKISISGAFHREPDADGSVPILIQLQKSKISTVEKVAEKVAKMPFIKSAPVILPIANEK
jgi:homoserine dehydrogenase